MLGGRLYDADTLAPADQRGGQAPTFYWQGLQHGLPTAAETHGCAACRL
jgi:hypothetical protein